MEVARILEVLKVLRYDAGRLLILALERQRQVDLCEFEAGLVYAAKVIYTVRTCLKIIQAGDFPESLSRRYT